jgi:DDE superfamily endonuclease
MPASPADALIELADALLCAPTIPSLAHLSLEPAHRRGWGSVYDALASGGIDTERLRDLLASVLPSTDPLVFAVDVTTWPLAAVTTRKAVSGLPRRRLGGVNRLTVVLRPRRQPWFMEVGAR